MNTKMVDDLGQRAATAAMQGAVDFMRANNLKLDVDVPCEPLLAELKARCQAALGSALDEAREAFDLGMGQVAVATFLATMTLAGVAAVKAVR